MRRLERRIARLERALVMRRLLARLAQAQRALQVLERQRREAAKATPQVPPPPLSPPVRVVAESTSAVMEAPAHAPPAEPQPVPASDTAIEPERNGEAVAPGPPRAWLPFDNEDPHMVRAIRWVPMDERYAGDDPPRKPEDEEYDPFAEFDED
ncbi:hypothetical protein SAMN02745126_00617 [Enhydrobacter aerosaccus]|uniref:Uncharacterized protein n=1 Tax=Enhydrobacter aerosaccus TaxID=225324 RepID=A0A1T4K035_9HYPH|nr:hypothetical protein [Enhydrobacter aerosaccus]SJZ35836.1 hypothetical protein SAMN02745126_00617 [Enhydrobacter aerosaccus]